MHRSDFDKLEVRDQIEYINNKLAEGNTLTNICKCLDIGRSTIRDRFKKISYEYNKSINQYECIVEIVESKEIEPKRSEQQEYNPIKLESSNKVVGTERLSVEDFEGDIVVRSYKLYESIQKEFADFCKVNNKYKVQDILSQALKEFLDKYS